MRKEKKYKNVDQNNSSRIEEIENETSNTILQKSRHLSLMTVDFRTTRFRRSLARLYFEITC